MPVICPQPRIWSNIYTALLATWEEGGQVGAPPPKPLILGGWAYSNDIGKVDRWQSTLRWAADRKLELLIPLLSGADLYEVETPSDYDIGPGGGTMYLPWDFTAKQRPSDAACDVALRSLQRRWSDIAGESLARITHPSAFTGRRRRALTIRVLGPGTPPWGGGGWRSREEEKRRSFTRLRATINQEIAPHAVDHIRFETISRLPQR